MIPMIADIPIACINYAAVTYHVPATMILSIIKTEGGKNGDASRNKDGSIDYGVMQINSRWLESIAPYGYTRHDLQYDPCKNVAVGAWVLGLSVAEGKDVWRGVGNYHSHTPKLNVGYSEKVKGFHEKFLSILKNKNQSEIKTINQNK